MNKWMVVAALLCSPALYAYEDLDQNYDNKKSSQDIEVEYSENLREENQGHSGAIVIDEFAEFEQLDKKPTITSSPARSAFSSEGSSTFGQRFDNFLEEYFYHNHSASYSSNLKMREQRKLGLGALIGGSAGQFAGTMELNFEDTNSAKVDFGGGDGYRAFQIVWKHSFEGEYLSPYVSGGYSRWFNSSGRGDYDSSDVLKRVLTDNERNTGQFAADFVTASAGLQYNQLRGEYVGMSFYGEITGMYEVSKSVLVPNGSVGGLFYF